VLFITPVILVRVFTVENYGKYREFMICSGMLVNLAGFSINKSLLYFLTKYKKTNGFVFNTIFLNGIITLFLIILLLLFENKIFNFSYDFVYPLIIYLILFLNFDFCESYWIAVKKINYVWYYTTFRGLARSCVVILTACIFDDIIIIIYGLLCVEFFRLIFVFIYSIRSEFLLTNFKLTKIKEHLSYIFPIGLSNIFFYLNKEISKFFILFNLGVEYLAFYSIGSYQIPVVGIIRGSIGDIFFPEICKRNQKNINEGFLLWKKINIIYLASILPVFMIFFYYAEFFINFMFTEKYLKSVVIFKIYICIMIKECFEVGTPLRSLNRNKYYAYGSLFGFISNITILIIFSTIDMYIIPAVAYVVSDFVMFLYMARKVMFFYNINIKKIFFWKKIAKIFLISLVSAPVLFLNQLFDFNILFEFIFCSTLYLIIYLFLLDKLKIEELNYVKDKIKIFNKKKLVHV